MSGQIRTPFGWNGSMSRVSKPTATILVVDSNPITLLATAGVLDSQGYACICAGSHGAAEKAVAQEPLDALVIDVGDDAEAALKLIDRLRRADVTDRVPAVMIADNRWTGLQPRCEAIRSARCLFKPVDPNVLLDIVHQSLWMPQLLAGHRRRGTRPQHAGWVNL